MLNTVCHIYCTSRREVAQAADCCFLHQRLSPHQCVSERCAAIWQQPFTSADFPHLLYTRFAICHTGHYTQLLSRGDYSIEPEYKKARLMCVVDLLNEWRGSNTLFFGAQGIERAWKMRQERRSPLKDQGWGYCSC
jgi:hypothetical protein